MINFDKLYNFAKNFQNKNKIMKKKGSKCDFILSRNENLKREFFARLGKNKRSISDVIAAVSSVGADRFYISEERAFMAIKRFHELQTSERPCLPADFPWIRNPEKRKMLCEIYERVKKRMEESPGLSLKDAVYEVVNSPAPAFYLTRCSIRTILYKYLSSC